MKKKGAVPVVEDESLVNVLMVSLAGGRKDSNDNGLAGIDPHTLLTPDQLAGVSEGLRQVAVGCLSMRVENIKALQANLAKAAEFTRQQLEMLGHQGDGRSKDQTVAARIAHQKPNLAGVVLRDKSTVVAWGSKAAALVRVVQGTAVKGAFNLDDIVGPLAKDPEFNPEGQPEEQVRNRVRAMLGYLAKRGETRKLPTKNQWQLVVKKIRRGVSQKAAQSPASKKVPTASKGGKRTRQLHAFLDHLGQHPGSTKKEIDHWANASPVINPDGRVPQEKVSSRMGVRMGYCSRRGLIEAYPSAAGSRVVAYSLAKKGKQWLAGSSGSNNVACRTGKQPKKAEVAGPTNKAGSGQKWWCGKKVPARRGKIAGGGSGNRRRRAGTEPRDEESGDEESPEPILTERSTGPPDEPVIKLPQSRKEWQELLLEIGESCSWTFGLDAIIKEAEAVFRHHGLTPSSPTIVRSNLILAALSLQKAERLPVQLVRLRGENKTSPAAQQTEEKAGSAAQTGWKEPGNDHQAGGRPDDIQVLLRRAAKRFPNPQLVRSDDDWEEAVLALIRLMPAPFEKIVETLQLYWQSPGWVIPGEPDDDEICTQAEQAIDRLSRQQGRIQEDEDGIWSAVKDAAGSFQEAI